MANSKKANQKIKLQQLRRENRELKKQMAVTPEPTRTTGTAQNLTAEEIAAKRENSTVIAREMKPESEKPGAESKRDKRNRKEPWRNYDSTGQGGKHFDNKDLAHLVAEGWSHNDIYKAASMAGRVTTSADRQLGLLGTADSKYSPFKKGEVPRDVMWSAAMGGANPFSLDFSKEAIARNTRFLGGDPEDKKNWVTAYNRDEKGRRSEGYYGSLGNDATQVWGRANTQFMDKDKRGKQQEVLQWNGLDGEGRALALGGIQIGGKDSHFDRENRSTSWVLPKGIVDRRFRDRVKDATGGKGDGGDSGDGTGTGEENKPPAPLPTYDFTPSGADYGTYTYEMDNSMPLFDTFTKRFAAADAFKARIGLG